MDQVSRPMLIALAATLCFAAAWMTVLRPKAETGGQAAEVPAPVSGSAAPASAPPAEPAGGAAAKPAAKSAKPAAKPAEPAAKPAKPAVKPTARAAATSPPKATVLLFSGRGADDRVAREVVAGLDRRGLRVVSGSLADVADHRDVLGSVTVRIAPTIVVIGADGTARRIEGLPDAAQLRQALAEAR